MEESQRSQPRLKSEWMSYFEPWHWIISAAPFRDEYPQLVDLAGIESELSKMEMKGQGYAFIMNSQGVILSHPTWKGRNMMDVADAVSGRMFVREIIASIHDATAQQRPEGPAGITRYAIKDPDTGRIFTRMMNYRYVPEVDWIVGVVTDLDQLEAPLRVVRNTQWTVMGASLLLALIVVVWAVRPMTRSIDDLATAVEKIDGGNLDTPLPPSGSDEIGRLSSAFSRMAERLARYTDELEQRVAERTAELEQANSMLAELSNTDGLTGLANRRRLDAVLSTEWSRAYRNKQDLALLLLDVDHFKKFNDRYGHMAGDECLKQIARILQENARRAGDLAARYGGEEFAVVAISDAGGAACLAEAIRRAVEDAGIRHEDSQTGCVTVSIGIAAGVPNNIEALADLLRAADAALYRAKEEGRNRVALTT